MTKGFDADIAIIGGGMVGLSLAHMLLRALPEMSVCLIEKRSLSLSKTTSLPSFDGRSSALSMGSVEVLRALGLWQAISPAATAIREVHVSDKGHFGRMNYSENREPLGFVVSNEGLGQGLLAGLTDARIDLYSSAEVKSIQPVVGGAELMLERESGSATLKTRLVVVADGSDSVVRDKLGIQVDTFDYQQHAIIANLEFEQPHNGRAFERFTPEGPMAVLPTGGDKSRSCALVMTRPQVDAAETVNLPDEKFIDLIHKQFGYRLGRVLKLGNRAAYPLKRVLAREQVRSSVAILGNAAHFLHPVAGQGFNLALRDAMQLVSVLVENRNTEKSPGDLSVLREYLNRQSLDQSLTLALSHNFNRLFSTEQLWLQAGRNFGLFGLEVFSKPKRGFFSQMMGKGQARADLEFLRDGGL